MHITPPSLSNSHAPPSHTQTLDGEPCGFSWCRPCKLLLGHLVRCYEPEKCGICTPRDLPKPFEELKTLNWLREQLVHQQQPPPQQQPGGVEAGVAMASAAGGPAHVHVEGVCPQAHDICAMDDAPGFGEVCVGGCGGWPLCGVDIMMCAPCMELSRLWEARVRAGI
jgi:hypothetical protein